MRTVGSITMALGCAALLAATPAVAAADDSGQNAALTTAYNGSGQRLFAVLAAKPGNIVLSPYSIGTAMAMALSGARGQTAVEMTTALEQTLPRAQFDAANGRVLAALNGYDRSAAPPTCPPYGGLNLVDRHCEAAPISTGRCFPGLRLEGGRCVGDAIPVPSAKILTANALMLTKAGNVISADYAASLRAHYAADVFHDATLDDVNTWVKRKTEGKIEKLLDSLDPSALSVILNAVYFKARWQDTFDRHNTRDDHFHLSSSRQVSVPMMRRQGRYAFVARQGYRAIRLPYSVPRLAMVVVLPDQVDGLPQVSARLDGTEVASLVAALRGTSSATVALSMPRFKARFRTDLVPAFKQVGMRLAFDPDRADFSGMTNRPPAEVKLMIGAIVHEAVIDVMEDGTEAAAATAVSMLAGSAMVRKVEPFAVDRPFLFYIVDDSTGAILFQGRVVDPRA